MEGIPTLILRYSTTTAFVRICTVFTWLRSTERAYDIIPNTKNPMVFWEFLNKMCPQIETIRHLSLEENYYY